MRPNNINLCVCGHDKHEHIVNNKFETKACSYNQKRCDCWEYNPRSIERNDNLLTWEGK